MTVLGRWENYARRAFGLRSDAGETEYITEEFSSCIGTHYRITHTPSGLVCAGSDQRLVRESLERRVRERVKGLDSPGT